MVMFVHFLRQQICSQVGFGDVYTQSVSFFPDLIVVNPGRDAARRRKRDEGASLREEVRPTKGARKRGRKREDREM